MGISTLLNVSGKPDCCTDECTVVLMKEILYSLMYCCTHERNVVLINVLVHSWKISGAHEYTVVFMK